jgi:hypothetical protein
MRNPKLDKPPLGRSIMQEVAVEFALKKSGLWRPDPQQQIDRDRLRSLADQYWHDHYDEPTIQTKTDT